MKTKISRILICLLAFSISLHFLSRPEVSKAESVPHRGGFSTNQAKTNSFNCATVIDAPSVECQALVALYNSTNGPGWTQSSNWLVSPKVENWNGITVSNGSVVVLSLPENNLSGTIPPELVNLSNLKVLSLSRNQLTGTIP